MRAPTLSLLSLTTFTAALPQAYTSIPSIPSSTSNAFILHARVLPNQANQTLAAWAQNRSVEAYHIGAGINLAAIVGPNDGAIFYLNGTLDDIAAGTTSVINDEGSPPFPVPMSAQGPDEFDLTYPTEHSVEISVNKHSYFSFEENEEGLQILRNELDESGEGGFMVCYNYVPYYRVWWEVAMYRYKGEEVPEQCVEVEFVPRCAVLNELPVDAFSSHEWAAEVECYEW